MLSATVVHRRLLTRARLRHLEVLAAIAELGTMRKAAEAVGMTQPALTHLLADLETLLGGALFERHARGMRLTPLGQHLLPDVRRVLDGLSQMAEHAGAFHAGVENGVRVAAITSAISGLLASVLPTFSRAHPHIHVELQDTTPQGIRDLLRQNSVDLVVCREPPVVPDGWRFEALAADRLAVAAGRQHPLARRRVVSREDLLAQTWLSLPVDSAASIAFDRIFPPGGERPGLRHVTARSTPVLWAMLTAEPLLALVPGSLVQQLVDAGQLVTLKLEQPLPLDPIGMLLPVGEAGRAAQALADALRECGAHLLHG